MCLLIINNRRQTNNLYQRAFRAEEENCIFLWCVLPANNFASPCRPAQYERERAAELAPRSNSDCLSCNRNRTMYWHSVLFARNNLARACPRKSSDVPRAKPLPPFRQFPFPIKLSTNHAERAPWHSFYVMHLKLQLHQRNYISGAERRIIQPYPIVGITHDNKKAHYRALPWHTSYRAILWHLITGVNAIYR